MEMMSSGLEAAAGDKMKSILERLTANRFMGVLVGAAITAVIQSSSATTVMVVGFVNAGMMTLNQAVWIIMGANIGTTITGILVSLDMGALAPLFAFVGVVLVVFLKTPKVHHIGQILAGLGVLFIGMETMSGAMSPLRESEMFIDLVSNFSNPLLGILFGTVFTAVIQSSSAAVGILQTLADSGILPFGSAVYVLFGTNIGTCVTAVLSSMGANRNAKRATIIHMLFNVIGTVVFTVLVGILPITAVIEGAISGSMAQIAAMHTVFNIVTTCMLLPLGTYLAKLACVILPEQEQPTQDESVMHLVYLKPISTGGKGGGLGLSAMAIDQLRAELTRMLGMARENIVDGFDAVLHRDLSRLEREEEREEYLDYLNREISHYVSHIIAAETNEETSERVSALFTISGNIERIGDHADNLAGYTRMLKNKDIWFSETAQAEIVRMQETCLTAIDDLLDPNAGQTEWLSMVAQLEQKIDDMTDDFRRRQIERLRAGLCNQEACIIYSELLTDFERIGDHVLNIAEELTKARIALAA